MKRFSILATLLTVLSVFSAGAQIKYENDKLYFGDIQMPPGEWNKTAWYGSGHYWKFRTNQGTDTWFKLYLKESNARLSGNGGKIVFHDNTNYQSIHVKNVYNNSDARAKTDIADLSRTTNDVLKLRPVSYRFIDSPTPVTRSQTLDREHGFIAQEVKKVLPEAVITDADGNKLINYISIIPMLTGCIKELNARIAEIEAEINHYVTE